MTAAYRPDAAAHPVRPAAATRRVGKILSVVNFTEVAKKVNGGKPLTEYELTALYWTMEDALREELLGAFFSPGHHQVRFSIRIKDDPGPQPGRIAGQASAATWRNSASRRSGIPLTNLFVLYQDILRRLFRSQILTMGLVYAVLTLTFFGIFRSFKVALIGIAPNILSTLVVLGVMGWAGIPLDLMTITIAAIAMGIAVDDTIHYIHRYLEELARGCSRKGGGAQPRQRRLRHGLYLADHHPRLRPAGLLRFSCRASCSAC